MNNRNKGIKLFTLGFIVIVLLVIATLIFKNSNNDLVLIFYESIIFLALLVILVYSRYLTNPQKLRLSFLAAINFTRCNFQVTKNKKKQGSLIEFFYLIVVTIIPLVILIWLIHFWGDIFSLIVAVAALVLCLILFHEKGYLQLYLLILPVFLLNLFWGSKTISALLMTFIVEVFLYAKFSFTKKKETRKRKYSRGYRLFKNYLRLADIIHKKIYDKEALYFYQSTVILIMLLFYVFGPHVIDIMPQEIRELKPGYMKVVNDSYPYISYIALVFYSLLALQNSLPFFVKPLLAKNRSYIVNEALNFLLTVIFAIMILVMLVIPVLLFAVVLIYIGNAFAGKELSIIIGFFVFPIFITKIYSYLLALIIQLYPGELLEDRTTV